MNLIYFRAEPDLEFEGLLKRQHTRVKYFQGSLMNAMDLERSKVTAKPPSSELAFAFMPEFAFVSFEFSIFCVSLS